MGSHIVIDFVGVTKVNLDDMAQVDTLLSTAIKLTDCTIIGKQEKKFEP